ncbi:hypothetical protein AgCh_013990 [Apium graveolens]
MPIDMTQTGEMDEPGTDGLKQWGSRVHFRFKGFDELEDLFSPEVGMVLYGFICFDFVELEVSGLLVFCIFEVVWDLFWRWRFRGDAGVVVFVWVSGF